MNTEQKRAEFEDWARWYALPVTRLVNDDRYESLETEAAYKAWQAGRAAQEDSEDKWRDLALQFDGHRMQALAWLKQILAESPADAWPFARTFLKSPPKSGEAVLAERIEELAALQSQDREDAERYRWLKANGSMAVDSFAGKFRVVDAAVSLVITDWVDSFDEAIDAAMEEQK